jgi:hypothetical protein
MAVLGLIGGPLICASGIAVMFEVFDQGGVGQGIATISEFNWELSLGIWLTVKGFKPSPITIGVRPRSRGGGGSCRGLKGPEPLGQAGDSAPKATSAIVRASSRRGLRQPQR